LSRISIILYEKGDFAIKISGIEIFQRNMKKIIKHYFIVDVA